MDLVVSFGRTLAWVQIENLKRDSRGSKPFYLYKIMPIYPSTPGQFPRLVWMDIGTLGVGLRPSLYYKLMINGFLYQVPMSRLLHCHLGSFQPSKVSYQVAFQGYEAHGWTSTYISSPPGLYASMDLSPIPRLVPKCHGNIPGKSLYSRRTFV